MLVCLALSPVAQAVSPLAPDVDRGGGNTSDGANALGSLTPAGQFNSAFGFVSLLVLTDADFNTGIGAGALLLNNAPDNTAVGAGAMLTNATGINNTACGGFALFSNLGTGDLGTGSFNNAVGASSLLLNFDGDSNNALGESALFSNVHAAANTGIGDVALAHNDETGAGTGNANTAVGAGALFSNVDGESNNAIGFNALGSNVGDTSAAGSFNNAMGFDAMGDNVNGLGNVAVGDSAGAGVEGDFNIYIGAFAGPAPSPAPVAQSETIRIGDVFNTACFIGGISGVPVSGDAVCVDANGQLGSCAPASPGKTALQQLKATTERQAAVIALQEGQIKALTAGLKQQAQQIQQVSAQLEMVRPTPRVVENR